MESGFALQQQQEHQKIFSRGTRDREQQGSIRKDNFEASEESPMGSSEHNRIKLDFKKSRALELIMHKFHNQQQSKSNNSTQQEINETRDKEPK